MLRTLCHPDFSLLASTAPAENKTVDQLKAEAEKASEGQQAKLYAEIAEKAGRGGGPAVYQTGTQLPATPPYRSCCNTPPSRAIAPSARARK